MLFYCKTGADSETIFKQNFSWNHTSEGNCGKGFYFFKSAEAALKSIQF